MRTTRGLPSATTFWVYSTLLAIGYLAGQPSSKPDAAPNVVVQAEPAAPDQISLMMRPTDGTPAASKANSR